MKKNGRKIFWITFIVAVALVVLAVKIKPTIGDIAASLEPSARASTPDLKITDLKTAVPAPGHPFFKKADSAHVSTIVAEPPQAGGVNGAPKIMKTDLGFVIPPLCFEQLFGIDGPKSPIDVTSCEKSSGYKNIKTGLENGLYRSLYEFPSEPDMPPEKGFSSYEMLGQTAAGTAIQTYNESGGTGRFSSLIIVKLNGSILSLVDQIAGGDRCNGGLTEAKVENGKLVYSVNVTPGDFPVLAWGTDKGLKPYEALESSAMSCFGTATYSDGQFISVTLNPKAIKEGADWASQYTYQKCFDDKFENALKTGQASMDAAKFKSFMDEFLAACQQKK